MSDYLVRELVGRSIPGFAAVTTDLAEEASAGMIPASASAALGRSLTAGLLLGANLRVMTF